MADPRAYLAPFLSTERRTLSIRDALAWMNEANASDFFLKVGEPVVFKVDGQVRRLATEPFTEDHLGRFMDCFLDPADRARFEARREVDLVHADEGHRYRVHIGMGNVGPYAVVRRITQDVLPLEKIGLPARALAPLQRLRDGLVLIAGPTGQGKTVTAVALLDWIARNRASMILTLEDPIEYILKDDRGFFIQREVGMHVESFADGVRAALRENLDVVFVGEMREPETIEQVLKASEMGHLVISTIHAEDTISALGRIVGSVRPEHEARIRYTLSSGLAAVITQRLLPGLNGGRVLAAEVVLPTTAVRTVIRSGELAKLTTYLGKPESGVTYREHLHALYTERRISAQTRDEELQAVQARYTTPAKP